MLNGALGYLISTFSFFLPFVFHFFTFIIFHFCSCFFQFFDFFIFLLLFQFFNFSFFQFFPIFSCFFFSFFVGGCHPVVPTHRSAHCAIHHSQDGTAAQHRVGTLMAHHPAWMSHHPSGSRQDTHGALGPSTTGGRGWLIDTHEHMVAEHATDNTWVARSHSHSTRNKCREHHKVRQHIFFFFIFFMFHFFAKFFY